MTRYGRRLRLFAAAMAAQAGFVDALGFLALGGYFVSFMSGNSTRLAVELASHLEGVLLAAALLALFVVGVIVGTLAARRASRHRLAVVQSLVTALLAIAALAQAAAWLHTAVASMVLAMGAANAAFERDGEVAIGVTYVTGALVKTGQHLAAALTGGDRAAWLWPALLWLGLTIGAALGAWAYGAWALASLWIVVVFGALLATIALRLEPR